MLLFLAPIGSQRIVNEMTLHPRPASLRRAFAVETDHPRIHFAIHPAHEVPDQAIVRTGGKPRAGGKRFAVGRATGALPRQGADRPTGVEAPVSGSGGVRPPWRAGLRDRPRGAGSSRACPTPACPARGRSRLWPGRG